ncbi:4'-phosphopantetheinyl transferase superfamily protein, partial [Clavibacter michiganensis]|uniref:4'-phosphopantetheinyl transferase superfamily protein n=1 Tax=Clavibacter michiganensis TaxID=28447 RepID=UPI002930322A
MLFSAKESVGKAHFARYREWLGFADLHVTLHPDGAFTARRSAPGPIPFPAYRGGWCVTEGIVLTCAWLAVPRIPSAVARPLLPPGTRRDRGGGLQPRDRRRGGRAGHR